MSEFDKLMASKRRPVFKRTEADKREQWRIWKWVVVGGIIALIVPPHVMGLLILLPTLMWGVVMHGNQTSLSNQNNNGTNNKL